MKFDIPEDIPFENLALFHQIVLSRQPSPSKMKLPSFLSVKSGRSGKRDDFEALYHEFPIKIKALFSANTHVIPKGSVDTACLVLL
jgi:hypothetical protein